MKSKLESPPADDYLISKPYIHNAYIAGYIGYLGLESMSEYAPTPGIVETKDRLLSLRASSFSKDFPYVVPDTEEGRTSIDYNRALNIARNFMFLVPELANYLHDNALLKVQQAIDEYCSTAPYWFVTKFDSTAGEGVLQHLFDYPSIFQAKAGILKESREALAKYLDVPAFDKGDLFYIQNLVAILQAPSELP